MSITDIDFETAVTELQKGGLVAFPTETVYGLGADAFNPVAVAKIFEAKNRPHFDPLIVHVFNLEMARSVASEFPPLAEQLVKKFWPGPLTVILPKRELIPDIVTSGLSTVGIRVPAHPIALELIKRFGRPIAAPSANPFGSISPTTADHVRTHFGDRFPILDGDATTVGIESTIIDFSEGQPALLRPGGLSLEKIIAEIGRVNIQERSDALPKAPGQLSRHYAPKIPLIIFPFGTLPTPVSGKKCACLLPAPMLVSGFEYTEVLSQSNDLTEIAVNLFAALRRLENLSVDLIVAVETTSCGLGLAINDRLRRAASPN